MYPFMSYICNSISIQMLQKNAYKNKQSPKLPTSLEVKFMMQLYLLASLYLET